DILGGIPGTAGFMRVFVIPGVYHCDGGYVPYQEDFLGAMVQWVESSRAPDSILATAVLADGRVRRRPVYAYPVRARFHGGNVNDARSFGPEPPAREPDDHYDWLGGPMLGAAPR
ncbi:MAG TPA: tannase/feruloyl esterase family alpha/beta hydrolase, partial [Steroidobacteraceae bacterium]|nr:tannase/feruloyl esterase family alpha/beta hydrolase [Steroidobacteraceae bacterium]